MTEDDLTEIEARFQARDVLDLCAEVRRLRAENATLTRCVEMAGDARNPFGDQPGDTER